MRTKTIAYNVLTNLFLQVIIVITGFIVPKIIISNYGSAVNGLISSITQFLAYITLLESGFAPVVKALLYKPIASKNKVEVENILSVTERFFKKIAKIFIIYIVFLILLYPLIVNNEFDFIFTASLIIIISISTFSEYYFGMTYRIYLGSAQKTYIVSIIQIVGYIISTISIIICAKLNCSIHILKLVSGLVFVLRPLLQNYYVKKKYNICLKNINSDYKIKNKWDGLVQHIAAVIHSNTDITLLTFFSKLSEVSVYSVYALVVAGVKKTVYVITNGMEESFGDMIAKNEKDSLNSSFRVYETVYLTIVTIIFTCTLLLITPFVSVYTKNVTDANYIRYTFGYLLVIAEYICVIRNPYISLAYAAGHFKETKVGAVVECLSNILISLLLIKKYGIIGVAIGTIVAMTIRTIEFLYHSNKYVLESNIIKSIKKVSLVIIETILIIIISNYLPFVINENYLNWVTNAIMVGLLSTIVVVTINFIFYKNDFKQFFKSFMKLIRSNKD